MHRLRAVIFDLDGVLVDTSVYHARAWANLVRSLGHKPPENLEEQVKGISRLESLKIALGNHASSYNERQLQELAGRKNAEYLRAVEGISCTDVYPGAVRLLCALRSADIRAAIGSASRNAHAVLKGLGIKCLFDAVSDGHTHTLGKPHPEVFLHAASSLGVAPCECIVIEDAAAGIEAALRGGFVTVGMGDRTSLQHAHLVIDSLEELTVDVLCDLHRRHQPDPER